MTHQTITTEVREILSQSIITAKLVQLPSGKLPKPLYAAVNKAIENVGGKWNKTAQAHLFTTDARPKMEALIASGISTNEKQLKQQFYTPEDIAFDMCRIAQIRAGHQVLEPSAGLGMIALCARDRGGEVTCVESDHDSATALRNLRGIGDIIESDFLSLTPLSLRRKTNRYADRIAGAARHINRTCHDVGSKMVMAAFTQDAIDHHDDLFDIVLMNPPFTKDQDIAHVLHAWHFLRPGGRLISITSKGWSYGQRRKAIEFKEFVDDHRFQETQTLPPGTFRASGTDVETLLISLVK